MIAPVLQGWSYHICQQCRQANMGNWCRHCDQPCTRPTCHRCTAAATYDGTGPRII